MSNPRNVVIVDALRKSSWVQKEAAKLLGLSYDQMRALMRKHHQTTRPGRQKKEQK